MFYLYFVVIATCLLECFAKHDSKIIGSSVILEERDLHDDEWVKKYKPSPSAVIDVKLALRQQNLEHAERFIMEVSDPLSLNFGQHWHPEKIAETFAPHEATVVKTTRWLSAFGLESSGLSHSAGNGWLNINATVAKLERLLEAEYYVFEHKRNGHERLACDSYKIPAHLQDSIDFIMPTVHLNGLEQLRHHVSDADGPSTMTYAGKDKDVGEKHHHGHKGLTGLSDCGNLITIECLRAIYKFPTGENKHKSNRMGIGEWHDYLYRPDLRTFFGRLTKPEIPGDTFPEFVSIDGGKHANRTIGQTGQVIESALDFQIAYSMIYPQNLRLYQVGDSVNVNDIGTFNIFLDALDASYCTYKGGDSQKHDPHYPDTKKGGYKGPLQCGGAPISNVISISYAQVEAALPRRYQTRQCHEYLKLGLMGVSVLFASGDSGVANSPTYPVPNKCLARHSTKRSINGTRFSPGFPDNCPYVTTVGATQLLHYEDGDGQKAIFRGERAVSHGLSEDPQYSYYSSGGFSNYFEMPEYQSNAVTHYLKNYPPPYGPDVFNKSGKARAFPDVSALGLRLAIVHRNNTRRVAGTSASTPIVASIVNMLNEERFRAGKGPIGFLNPVFYANPDAFNDITIGDNPGCGTKGFACQAGWDPVTGLGTPNYPKLLKVFMDLP